MRNTKYVQDSHWTFAALRVLDTRNLKITANGTTDSQQQGPGYGQRGTLHPTGTLPE